MPNKRQLENFRRRDNEHAELVAAAVNLLLALVNIEDILPEAADAYNKLAAAVAEAQKAEM